MSIGKRNINLTVSLRNRNYGNGEAQSCYEYLSKSPIVLIDGNHL